MDFIRFSGELFIYYVLIALGGGVLMASMRIIFQSIGIDLEPFFESWLLPCGAVGAVVVASWLVEAKQSVIENMAPVLTRLFTPFSPPCWSRFGNPAVDRTRSRHRAERAHRLRPAPGGGPRPSALFRLRPGPPGAPRRLRCGAGRSGGQCAIGRRGSAVGHRRASPSSASPPNRVAALGENVVLLVNLAWSAVLYIRFLRGRGSFTRPRTVADELHARLRRVGGDRRDRLSAGVRVHLMECRCTRSPQRRSRTVYTSAHQPGQRSYSRPPEDALGDASGLPATQLHSAWGRMVPDIPDFCHELVVAPAEQQGEASTQRTQQ